MKRRIVSEEPDGAELASGSRLKGDDFLLFGTAVAAPFLRHVAEIIALEALGENTNSTRVTFAERSAVVRKPLKECAARLDPRFFFKAHRGCVVNMAHIRKTTATGRNLVLILSNDREVVVARRAALLLKMRSF